MKGKDILREIPIFMSLYAIFLILGMTLLAYFGKENLHLYFNAYHSSFFDVFFKYFTDYSLHITLIVLICYIIWKGNLRELLLLLFPYGIGTVVLTLIRKPWFIHVHRPTYYFELRNVKLHLVEGVTSQIPYTFPSGHSMNAFLFFAVCSLLCKHKFLQIIFFSLALLVAISRIYLSKHFVLDTLGGSFIGISLCTATFYLLQNSFFSKSIFSKNIATTIRQKLNLK